MVGTFALVLVFTMIKEAVEDISRHKQDREVNNKEVLVFDNVALKYVFKKWQDVKTGEILKVTKDQEFPADMVLLKSDKDSGIVFVDTMNLDGEVNSPFLACLDEPQRENGRQGTQGFGGKPYPTIVWQYRMRLPK